MTFNKKRIAQPHEQATKLVGTILFTLRSETDPDWATNSNGCNFGEMYMRPVTVKATKQPDRTLWIEIEGPFDGAFLFTVPIPPTPALRVAITWEKRQLQLALNGEIVQTITA